MAKTSAKNLKTEDLMSVKYDNKEWDIEKLPTGVRWSRLDKPSHGMFWTTEGERAITSFHALIFDKTQKQQVEILRGIKKAYLKGNNYE